MKSQYQKIIGGEHEFANDGLQAYRTDSGRSSLRFILKNMGGGKRFLLPDFLCKIVVEVFEELDIKFDLYHLNADLTIDEKSIKNLDSYDVLYVIDYFGVRDKYLFEFNSEKITVIEDAVFLPYLKQPHNIHNWISFNSLRKISFVPDGSIIKSTVSLDESIIKKTEAQFSSISWKAKQIKYEYLHQGLHAEDDYLKLFREAKNCLESQQDIFSISAKGSQAMLEFYQNLMTEQEIRLKNYNFLYSSLGDKAIKIKPEYHSFCILLVDDRDDLREFLFQHKIFLPVHWPRPEKFNNTLYDRVISIPLDSRYDTSDMERIVKEINSFYKTKFS